MFVKPKTKEESVLTKADGKGGGGGWGQEN